MSKILRITAGVVLILAGIGAFLFSGHLLLQSTDWIMVIAFISFLVISAAIAALGYAVIKGEDIREMLRDLLSGMSF